MITQNHQRLDGTPTQAQDMERGIWCGVRGCTFWTDDWNRVTGIGAGIPCCPECGAPGIQTTAQDWFGGAAIFQAEGNPGYVNFLSSSKEKCRRPMGLMAWYKEWLTENPNGRETNPRTGND